MHALKKNYGFGSSWMASSIGVRNMKNIYFGCPWDGGVYVKKNKSKRFLRDQINNMVIYEFGYRYF